MTRSILLAGAALIAVSISSLSAKASEAPWCAVINLGTGSVYEDCQYRSFDDCYRRGNILAGNRGFCNPSPYYVERCRTHALSETPRSPAVAATPDMSLMSANDPKQTSVLAQIMSAKSSACALIPSHDIFFVKKISRFR